MSVDFGSDVELLTIGEAAELLKISASGVRRLQRTRQLTFVKVGASIRFLKEDVALYLDKRRVKSIE
jgi:excisionase family DNA binding protein